MQPGKTSATLLFNAPTQYLIPVFQRGYVWTLEKQVAPLWIDIEDRALRLIERTEQTRQVGSQQLKPLQKHFLGSVVLTPVDNVFGRVTAYEVIDGQQRTTTLHLLLLAFRHATQKISGSQVPLMLDGLVRNAGTYGVTTDHHKVWPTKAGRSEVQFLDAAPDVDTVTSKYPAKEGRVRIERPLMIQAYLYFYHACLAFLRETELSDPVSSDSEQTISDALVHSIRHQNEIAEIKVDRPLQSHLAEKLFMSLQDLVQIMTLTLDTEDDPQVIFETLNARGEPLLASDLIRNFVFLEAARKDLPVSDLYAKYWEKFDEQKDQNQNVIANQYWREKERQGRITYPRIDLFFYHYTVMRRAQEVKVSHIFHGFKEWWQVSPRDIEKELGDIVQFSTYFKELISPDGEGYLAEFARLVKVLDVSTLTPLYLWLRAKYDNNSADLKQAVEYLASYITRRAVCGLTTKNYNRIFLKLLSDIINAANPVDTLRTQLIKLGGPSQVWPKDQEFQDAWMSRRVYEELKSGKVCAILRAIEFSLRSTKQETYAVPLHATLTVEHVLPQTWETKGYYPLQTNENASELTEAEIEKNRLARIIAVQTFGNLTLLTQPLNSSVSNGPFADLKDESGGIIEGKKSGFRKSLLLLNSYFQKPALTKWTDEDISIRGLELLTQAKKVWPRPIDA
jgi:hypothetical protein